MSDITVELTENEVQFLKKIIERHDTRTLRHNCCPSCDEDMALVASITKKLKGKEETE